ncbi:MAG: orotate phosphoribosyltransferase [Alphaproteobacteria bacterium]
MFTHAQIWQGLDRLAKLKGFSPSGLAKRAGLDPTSFNKSKRISPDGKPRWPSTESLSKVLSITNSTMSDFTALIDDFQDMKLNKNEKSEIARDAAMALIETESILFNAAEPFTLKSGKKSPVYIDCRRLISFVKERDLLMNHAARLIAADIGVDNIDVMAGGETAGIPYGAYISDRLHKPMIYVRKEPKGYGRMAQIEGFMPEKNEAGKKPNVILIEDLQTDGGSKRIFIEALREAGAKVEHAFVVFHYGIFEASKQNMKDLGISLHALTTWWDVLAVAKEKKYFDDVTLASVESFLNDPIKWQDNHE